MSQENDAHYILPQQLTIGLYIYLDLDWMSHPFSFSHFRIKNEEQIAIIRRLGLKKIRYDASKSQAQPLPVNNDAPPPPPPAATEVSPESVAKQARIAKLKERRSAIQKCEKQYLNATKVITSITRNLMSQPQETITAANQLSSELAQSMMAEKEIAIHLMNDKAMGEDTYYHSLNVSVLAMMLGREVGLNASELSQLGMGAIFHDIGKMKVPHKVLIKADNPNKAELDFIHQHVAYGVETGQKVGLEPGVIRLIAEHHEQVDGSGYPKGLKEDQIHRLSRILSIVNHYDNLCNPINIINALTPHEALSLMYSKQRVRFDQKVLGTFIHCLGVYPPGTLVILNNEIHGMVMSVNPAKPLKPGVVIYDESVPKEEAIIIDLIEDSDFSITKALRPAQLPAHIHAYLSPRARATYFFDGAQSGGGK